MTDVLKLFTELIYKANESAKSRLQTKARQLLGGSKADTSLVWMLKDKEDQWWYIGLYSNKFEDKYKTILSSEAHESYIEYLDLTGLKPVVTLWHEPRLGEEFWLTVWKNFHSDPGIIQAFIDVVYKDVAFARAEQVAYVNGFAVVLAKVFPDKQAVAERLAGMPDLGMSHGFVTGTFDDNIIDRYFTFEFTVLPRDHAANIMTSGVFSGLSENKMAKLEDAKRQFFIDALGRDDIVDFLEARTEEAQELLELVLRFKDHVEDNMADENITVGQEEEVVVEATPDEEEVVETPTTPETPEEEGESDESGTPEAVPSAVPVTMQQMMEFMTPLREVLEQMSAELSTLREKDKKREEALEALARDFGALKQEDDDKIAAQIAPQNFWTIGGFKASDSQETVVNTETAKKVVAETAPHLSDTPAELGNNPFADLLSLALSTNNRGK